MGHEPSGKIRPSTKIAGCVPQIVGEWVLHAPDGMISTQSRSEVISSSFLVALAVLCAACGKTESMPGNPLLEGGSGGHDSTAVVSASQGGAGGRVGTGGSTGGGGSIGTPETGNLPPSSSEPYSVTFMLENPSAASVFIWHGCLGYRFSIAQVTGNNSTDVSPRFFCGCNCSDSSCRSNPMCGPCASDAVVEVRPGESLEVNWVAQTVRAEQRAGYSCANVTFLPAGLYQITVPVYDSETEATAQSNPRQVTLDFVLPVNRNPNSIHLAPCGDSAVVARWPACAAATEQTGCEAAGGTWFASRPFCSCPTGQENCACTSSQHCLGRCLADQTSPPDTMAACGAVLAGRCTSGDYRGCQCQLAGPGQVPNMICVD
jgi:hypothetical protein